MEQAMTVKPKLRGKTIESKILATVNQAKEEIQKLTQEGKAWFAKMREVVKEKPREVIEEIEKAPKHTEKFLAPVDSALLDNKKIVQEIEEEKQNQTDTARLESNSPIERKIIIPEDLECVSDTGSGYADLYVDRAHQKAYRVVNPEKWKGGNIEQEHAAALSDFNQKVEVGRRDKTGLTPRIYAYDPENMTIEMEWIEGTDFTHVNNLPLDSARRFWHKLQEFHAQGLYHGDMWPQRHYVLTPSGDIRLVDNTSIKYCDTPQAIEKQQAIDQGVAKKRLRELYGISEANLTGKLFNIQEQSFGEFEKTVDEDLAAAINRRKVQFVYQRGIGFVNGDNPETRCMETSDFGSEKPMFGSCVSIAAWSPETRIGCLLHADKQTDLAKAKQLMQEKFGDNNVILSVIGGQTDNSEGLLKQVNATFSDLKHWKLSRLDILGPKFVRTRQLVLDAKTGKIYNLQGDSRMNMKQWSHELPADVKKRAAQAALIDTCLIVDVDI